MDSEDKLNVAEDENSTDPQREALVKILGGMEVGNRKVVSLEEFRQLMFTINSEFNLSGDNTGEIEGEGAKYAYSREGDESDVLVTRVV